MTVAQEFKTYINLVRKVLEQYPATRNSDTALYLKCCEVMGVANDELNIVTIHKTRQIVQNKEGKFLADPTVQLARRQRAKEIKKLLTNTIK